MTLTISGHAVVFGDRATVLHRSGLRHHEVIAPGAFEGVDLGRVALLIDHSEDLVLARAGDGTLLLDVTPYGLRFRADLPDDEVGQAVFDAVESGGLARASFSFSAARDSWAQHSDGVPIRLVERVAVMGEISLTARPAFELTNVRTGSDASCWGLDQSIDRLSRGDRTLADFWRVGDGAHPLAAAPAPAPASDALSSTPALVSSGRVMEAYASLAASRGMRPEAVRDMAAQGRLAEVVRKPAVGIYAGAPAPLSAHYE